MEPDERQKRVKTEEHSKEQKTVQKDWRMLQSFLESFGDEVHALGREELSAQEKRCLQQLVAGKLSEQERDELVSLLARNEQAMEFLAKELNEKNVG